MSSTGAKRIRFDSLSAARKKKKKSSRQQFLSVIMSEISGDAGEQIAEAFVKGHSEDLRELLDDVVNSIVKKAARK